MLIARALRRTCLVQEHRRQHSERHGPERKPARARAPGIASEGRTRDWLRRWVDHSTHWCDVELINAVNSRNNAKKAACAKSRTPQVALRAAPFISGL
jgi:hypothetical protein